MMAIVSPFSGFVCMLSEVTGGGPAGSSFDLHPNENRVANKNVIAIAFFMEF